MTCYGLEGPGIESRWGEIFRTYPDQLRGPPSLLYNGYRVFPGGKGGRGVMMTTHPLLVPRLRKSWAIPPLTLWVLLGLLWGSLHHNVSWKVSVLCAHSELCYILKCLKSSPIRLQCFWGWSCLSQPASWSCLPCFCRFVRCSTIAHGLPVSSCSDTDVVPPAGHISC